MQTMTCKGYTCRLGLKCIASIDELVFFRVICPKCRRDMEVTIRQWACKLETIYEKRCLNCGISIPLCGEGSSKMYREYEDAIAKGEI